MNFQQLRYGLVFGLLLLLFSTSTGWADTDVSNEYTKRIAEAEKQLAEAQAKLQKLREVEPIGMPQPVYSDLISPEWINSMKWRLIGPATMGGRITSLAVFDSDPSTYYVATASGGLLKTVNRGVNFEHLFDRQSTVSIGAVAVSQSNRNIVWVGTGEANPRNSVSYGDGVYKSVDGGKSWQNMGLKKSYQIGQILIHPKNPDIVYVGALGRLYGPNEERGFFKTVDGGKTWKKILYLDDKTGVIDAVMNPSDPETLLVATWERGRDEFDSFRGDAKPHAGTDPYAPSQVYGPHAGIWKTTDGGQSFHRLFKGLPTVKMGRIGLDYSRKNPNIVYAVIDTEQAGMGLKPTNSFLGVQTEAIRDGKGLQITNVTPDSPAAKAQLKVGDILLNVDSKELTTVDSLIQILRQRQPKDKVKAVYLRGKDKKEVEIELALRPGIEIQRPTLGIQIEAVESGIKITNFSDNSFAKKAGLKIGDILTHFDETPLENERMLIKLLASRKIGQQANVRYLRGKDKLELSMTLQAPVDASADRPYGSFLGGNRANIQDQQGPNGFQTGGIFKSTDGGETWTRVNSLNERPFYFSVVRVDPQDDNIIYVLGVVIHRSKDGGKTFTPDGVNRGVHPDQHALWINPQDGRHMILGTDGGFYATYDRAERWDHHNQLALGQFYHVAVDNRTPYRVYGGLQDNGSWGGLSHSMHGGGPINEDWIFVSGGDGFRCAVDSNNPDLVYFESQDGMAGRRNIKTGATRSIRPQPQAGAPEYRFNWNTPFILSQHNSQIYYNAGNYVFRSLQRGENLKIASPEITRTKRGSGTALAESPRNPDIIWAGTDDGFLWVTRNQGKTWSEVSSKLIKAGLPGYRWVASIEASRAADGRAYVVLDGHRSNDDAPHIFVTENFGESWRPLRANLPNGYTRVLREDIVNPNLLYVGTEFAVWASINRGESWTSLNGNTLPTVAIHEIAQPTSANEIVVATHGRSVWILDVTALRQFTSEIIQGKNALLIPSPAIRWQIQPGRESPYSIAERRFMGQNPQSGVHIEYVLADKAKVSLKIVDGSGKLVQELKANDNKGFHRIHWDLGRVATQRPKGPNAPTNAEIELNPLLKALYQQKTTAGTYRAVLTINGVETSQPLMIENDPNAPKEAGQAFDEVEYERALRKLLRNPADSGSDY